MITPRESIETNQTNNQPKSQTTKFLVFNGVIFLYHYYNVYFLFLHTQGIFFFFVVAGWPWRIFKLLLVEICKFLIKFFPLLICIRNLKRISTSQSAIQPTMTEMKFIQQKNFFQKKISVVNQLRHFCSTLLDSSFFFVLFVHSGDISCCCQILFHSILFDSKK